MQPKRDLRTYYTITYDGEPRTLDVLYTATRSRTSGLDVKVRYINWHGLNILELLEADDFSNIYLDILRVVGAVARTQWDQAEADDEERMELSTGNSPDSRDEEFQNHEQ